MTGVNQIDEELEIRNMEEESGSAHAENANALNEIIEILKPYLTDKSQEKVESLKQRLKALGIVTLSHLPVLTETDLPDLISVGDFRLMKNKTNHDNSGTSPTTPKLSPYFAIDVEKVLGYVLYSRIKEDAEIMSPQDRTMVVQALADCIRTNVKPITDNYVTGECLKVVKKFPTALGCIMQDDTDLLEAAAALKSSVMNRINYIKSEEKNKRGKNRSTDEAGIPKKKRFTKTQSYGIDPSTDFPNELPEGETPELQESKRLVLVELDKSGETVNIAIVSKIMQETYYIQRVDINSGLPMDKLLERWPFIGRYVVIQDHFERLMKLKVADCMQSAEKLFTDLEKFFICETNTKRHGSLKDLPKELRAILKRLNQAQKPSAVEHMTSIVLCCLIYMKVPKDKVFLFFEETTSFDEVQASALLPDTGKPIIAVLGKDILQLPKAYVVVDRCIVNETPMGVARAIVAWLMVHFVFKIEYESKAAPLLHFLQRKVFGINENGTRTERKKGSNGKYGSNPKEHPAAYLTLIKKLSQYKLEWNNNL